ncbi:type VII secretion-associated protein [Rhodococcus sp. X156]|uniref:type VII secretion-associated protein n=1 Tax=Rhodococcus sp. X156 TaxID=2499145 RepID=UPI000FDAB518|nr:type VII secretion-associated protein [Rhodococcus sp. X156]
MSLAVAVDLGSASTCVAISVDGEPARIVPIDGAPTMSSAVYADGHALFVGAEADGQAALNPARYEPTPVRRIDEESLLLGEQVVPVRRALAAVLARAVREAVAAADGEPVDVLVLTHPAEWGPVRLEVLTSAAQGLAPRVVAVPEPVAAALAHEPPRTGALVAVVDVGAGSTDVAVLEGGATGYRVLTTRTDGALAGAEIDLLLLAELGRRVTPQQRPRWDAVLRGSGLGPRQRYLALRADVRTAKESLSRHSYADVPLPGGLLDGHLTRADLERLVGHRVDAVVDLLEDALRQTGAVDRRGGCRAEVLLVGGASRTPLVASRIHQRLGVLPRTTEHPETSVARGALRAAPPEPENTAERVPERARSAADRPVFGAVDDSRAGRRRARRRRRRVVAAAVLVLAAGAVGAVLVAQRPTAPTTQVVASGRATMTVPVDWQESYRGESTTRARLELTPTGTPPEPQRILLVQITVGTSLSQAELATALQQQLAVEQRAGKQYADFAADTRYADRAVTSYRELRPDGAVVDWYVLVQQGTQVSVGCLHAPGDSNLDAACTQAVRTVRVGQG